MCLAVPGQVIEWINRDRFFETASVQFGGVRRQVNMSCVPEAKLGDFVLVHAGIAINTIDAQEAEETLRALEELDLENE